MQAKENRTEPSFTKMPRQVGAAPRITAARVFRLESVLGQTHLRRQSSASSLKFISVSCDVAKETFTLLRSPSRTARSCSEGGMVLPKVAAESGLV